MEWARRRRQVSARLSGQGMIKLTIIFLLERLDWFPACRRVYGDLFNFRVGQVVQDGPDVLVYFQTFQQRRFANWKTLYWISSIAGERWWWEKGVREWIHGYAKTHLQTGHRQAPRSQFSWRYDSKSKHWNKDVGFDAWVSSSQRNVFSFENKSTVAN